MKARPMIEKDLYAWIADEAKQVRWRRFFSFNPNAAEDLPDAQQPIGGLPPDYVQFVMKFGETRLFREFRTGSYKLAVFSKPRVIAGRNSDVLVEIGFYINGGYAHFRRKNIASTMDGGVFEGAGLGLRKAADSFEEWIRNRFQRCRKSISKRDWKRVLEGPPPFTEEELRVIEARNQFQLERVGVASNGDMQIRVLNGSQIRLSHLTIGARVPGRLEGTVYLDVSGVGPHECRTIEHDCYKSIATADRVELFQKQLVDPEDREMFYELAPPQCKS